MPIVKSNDHVVLKHSSGAFVKVLYYGATVLEWKLADGTENLFLSTAAKLDGSKAVRGGIPLVFPVFGKSTDHPTAALPQHGFARISTWRLTGHTDNSVSFTLTQKDLDATSRNQWGSDFKLVYTVEIEERSLKNIMEVHNPGSTPFECNVLLHTYLRVPNVSAIDIRGLTSNHYRDKIEGTYKQETSKEVKITGPTDRVYEKVGLDTVIYIKDREILSMSRHSFDDVVVWNPYTEGAASMGDFEPKGGWKHMICVEAGNVSKWMKIPSGGSWTGSQLIRSHL